MDIINFRDDLRYGFMEVRSKDVFVCDSVDMFFKNWRNVLMENINISLVDLEKIYNLVKSNKPKKGRVFTINEGDYQNKDKRFWFSFDVVMPNWVYVCNEETGCRDFSDYDTCKNIVLKIFIH